MTRMLLVVLLAVSIGAFATIRSIPTVESEQHDRLMETARRLQERDKQLDALLLLLRTRPDAARGDHPSAAF